MFSSKELISLVFAHENDFYYGEDLVTRELNQYLWEQLHKAHFTAVYFLRAMGDELYVSSYGDVNCDRSVTGKRKPFPLQGGWLLRQLQARSDQSVAFVCPLADFCGVLSKNNWKKTLRKIAEENKRTGIFVLTAPPSPERTAGLLLTSPVFGRDCLNETAIMDLRGGDMPVDLYHSLKDRKWDSCHFLNACTPEKLRGLLLQLVIQNPERLEAARELDRLADYLYAWLKDPETVRVDVFSDRLPYGHYTYRSIYEALRKPENWNRFTEEGLRWMPAGLKNRTGDVAVVRDNHSYAGRCLRMTLPGWITDPQAEVLLSNIREAVCTVKNRLENPAMVNQAGKLLDRIRNTTTRDADTFLRRLGALRFCVTHIYADKEEGRILKIMDTYNDMLRLSEGYYDEKRNLELAERNTVKTPLLEIQLAQTRQSVKLAADTLRVYDDLIEAYKLALLNPRHTDTVAQLEQEIVQLQQKQAAVQTEPDVSLTEPVEESQPHILPDTEPEELIDLDLPELYDITPPV